MKAKPAMAERMAKSIKVGWFKRKLPLIITLYKTDKIRVINDPKR